MSHLKSQFLNKNFNFTIRAPQLNAFQETEYNILKWVMNGQITKLNDYIQRLSKDPHEDISRLVNIQDGDGRSPLFYSCYYNYKNLVVYLLAKGTDPYIPDIQGQNVFHVVSYYGRYECASLIINYEKHKLRKFIKNVLKEMMNEYKFKNTDVHKGTLVCPEKHLPEVQERFEMFRARVCELFEEVLGNLRDNFRRSLLQDESLNRNPIHYASLSKYTNCLKVAKFLLEINLESEGYREFEELFEEIQNLELNKEKRIDPRQYLQAFQMIENFLKPHEHEIIMRNFKHAVKDIQQQIINSFDSQNYTTMHLASFNGDYALLQLLIKHGGDKTLINDKSNKEVLEYAANVPVRKAIIDLKDAARKGYNMSFNHLVNTGNSIDEKKTIFGIAPIHNAVENACKENNYELLKEIIKCGADVNISDSNGWTPLHHACKYGNGEVVRILLDKGADVMRFSNKGYTPLHIAALHNNERVLDILVEKRSDLLINAVSTEDRFTALHLAAKKGNIEAVETLLKSKADLYAVTNLKWNALHIAVFHQQIKAIQLLCKHDADFDKLRNMKNSQGKTPKELSNSVSIKGALNTLWMASKQGDLDTVRKLVLLGEKVDQPTLKKNQTPLILATKNDHLLVVKFLIEKGADPLYRDAEGKTAKVYAYEKKIPNPKMVRIFDDDTYDFNN